MISAAALPTLIMVRAANNKGNIAPNKTPDKIMGSPIAKFIVLFGSTWCWKAASRERAVRTWRGASFL